jgi:hypothetical protein
MTVHQLFIDLKKAYDSVRREVLYNTLRDFWVHIKLVKLSKICLNEMCSQDHIDKHLHDNFPFQNCLKQEDALMPLLLNFAVEYFLRKVQEKPSGTEIEWDTSASGLR